jgi:hypothetical protein
MQVMTIYDSLENEYFNLSVSYHTKIQHDKSVLYFSRYLPKIATVAFPKKHSP